MNTRTSPFKRLLAVRRLFPRTSSGAGGKETGTSAASRRRAALSVIPPAAIAREPRVTNWRMTRTIGPGVSLTICGMGLSLDGLIRILDAFLVDARTASDRGVRLGRFLSQFTHPQPSAQGGTP